MTTSSAAEPAQSPEIDARVEEIFDKADDMMINQKNYEEATTLYQEILKLDPENIDGLNSLAQCVKTSGLEQLVDFNTIF